MRSTTKIGLGLLVVSFSGLSVLSAIVKDLEAKDADQSSVCVSLAPGEPWRATLTGPFGSCRGVHEIFTPSARFLPDTGDPVDLAVEAIDQRPLLAAMSAESTEFDAKLLEEPVEPTLMVQVPESLAGTSGEIVISGAIILSEVAVDRVQNAFKLKVDPRTFEETFAVSVEGADPEAAAGASPPRLVAPPRTPGADKIRGYGVLQGISTLLFMFSILLLLWSGIGARLFVTSCMMMAVPSFILAYFFPPTKAQAPNKEGAGIERAMHVSPSSPFTVRPDVRISTVDRLHRVSYLSAWLKGVGTEQIELTAKPTNNKPWSNPIEVGYVRVGPIFKTNRFRINPSLSVDLPSAEQVSGKAATLTVYGVIAYPDLGSLEILNPFDIEYDVDAQAFTETIELDFRPKSPAPEPLKRSRPESILLGIVSLGAFLLMFGILRGVKRLILG